MENYYTALNYTDTLENDNDHIMVKIKLPGEKESVTMNAMIASGATEHFIDREVCNKHGIKMMKAKNLAEIYLAYGKPSAMGPVTNMTKVPMDISSHKELATFQMANVQNHEVFLGMPWLREDNPTIDWNDKRVTFNSKRCTTWCLKSSPVAYAVPEDKSLEENLITTSSNVQAKKGSTTKNGPTANDQSVRVQKLSAEARVPMKRTARVASHDLYANEATNVPARGQAIVGTGIANGLPHNTYGRIAPRSSLAVKHRLTTNAGVIDSDSRGEVKVVLANRGDQPYRVEKGYQIAQRIIEQIDNRELQEVTQFDDTERGDQGFGSSNTTMDQRVKGQEAKRKNGNQRDIGKSLWTVLPTRRNNRHPKMGRSRPPKTAGSYQHQHRTGNKEQKQQGGPRRQGHGFMRVSSPVRCIRKRGNNDSTTTPTRN